MKSYDTLITTIYYALMSFCIAVAVNQPDPVIIGFTVFTAVSVLDMRFKARFR